LPWFGWIRRGTKALTQRIPLVGAKAPKHLGHRNFLNGRRMTASRLQGGQHLIANADHAVDQKIGGVSLTAIYS